MIFGIRERNPVLTDLKTMVRRIAIKINAERMEKKKSSLSNRGDFEKGGIFPSPEHRVLVHGPCLQSWPFSRASLDYR